MQAFRDALVAICDADTGVQAITGRAGASPNGNLVPWSDIANLPDEGIAYHVVGGTQTGQEGEQRRYSIQFSCFAKTIARAETLAARVTSEKAAGMFTHPKFNAEGVNAVPIGLLGVPVDATGLELDARKEHRVDVDVEFEVEFA